MGVTLINQLRGVVIRNVSTFSGNTILQELWVRTVAKHGSIVVAFNQHCIESRHDFAKTSENVPEIGEQSEALTRLGVFDHEAHTITGIVRRLYRGDAQCPNSERLARDEMVRASNIASSWMVAGGVPSSLVRVDRQTKLAMERADAADVIGVFVRKNNGLAVANVVSKFSQPRLGFAATNTGIKEYIRVVAANEYAIAGAS